MKEYRIEAQIKGRWFAAHNPYCQPIPKFATREEAAERLPGIKNAWEKYERVYGKENTHIPTDFRIVCRYVGEWEVVN